MALSDVCIRLLDAKDDRKAFNSPSEPLNRYLQQQSTQDAKRRVAKCFVAVDSMGNIAGYYTLTATGVAQINIPESYRKKLPRYPTVPAVLMGRLAVDEKYRGMGLGALLLADALKRIDRAEIAAYALVVEAKDEQAVAFYRHFGFISMTDAHEHLFFPLANLR
ncbi:GNAT family N-acetyltransferase [Neisseria yangbaofengii]|uniref:GNAT family N-acetyltransferase n=1 Tax=Neisseria yangbaofengii TaxID=2709396 RepID=UPI0013E9AAC9|nr:GNAT family N-acetyltransferase [Neisseria yangbaofengii]